MSIVEKIRVEVTAEDIAKGVPQECNSCPVAIAVGRACPAAVKVGVDGATIDIYAAWDVESDAKSEYVVARTPREVNEFIKRFDNGDPVGPFSFDLEVIRG